MKGQNMLWTMFLDLFVKVHRSQAIAFGDHDVLPVLASIEEAFVDEDEEEEEREEFSVEEFDQRG